MADLAGGAARRRRERRLRSWLRHERMTVRMELAAALHHSAGPETNDAVRSQKTVSSRGGPQERVQRHTMEHIVDFVCCAPLVQILDSCAAEGGTAARRAPVLRQAHDCSRAGYRSAQDSS